mgnify:CR=1 FL=1
MGFNRENYARIKEEYSGKYLRAQEAARLRRAEIHARIPEIAKIDGMSVVKNTAAFYIFPKLDIKKFNITSDKVFARDLLHATNILIVPGSGFDWPTPDHFRIVMLPRAEELGDAIRRMGEFLDGYKQK